MKSHLVILTLAILAVNGMEIHGGSNRHSIVIVDEDEPGEHLIVTGTVYAEDGKTPLKGIRVYVYHTDAGGYYRKGSNSSDDPRLNGTMRTNAEGKYEYHTIKPGSYPGSKNPAHVHYVLSGEGYSQQYDELMFEGDPFLEDDVKDESEKEGRFGMIQKLTKGQRNGWTCVKDVRMKKE
jgi:protocatechuate 3,4-dioxygenase, beta subunit